MPSNLPMSTYEELLVLHKAAQTEALDVPATPAGHACYCQLAASTGASEAW